MEADVRECRSEVEMELREITAGSWQNQNMNDSLPPGSFFPSTSFLSSSNDDLHVNRLTSANDGISESRMKKKPIGRPKGTTRANGYNVSSGRKKKVAQPTGLPAVSEIVTQATEQPGDGDPAMQPCVGKKKASKSDAPKLPKGRPKGTSRANGYKVSCGRPIGTTRDNGYKVSTGRPVGTTRLNGCKVSPGRPKKENDLKKSKEPAPAEISPPELPPAVSLCDPVFTGNSVGQHALLIIGPLNSLPGGLSADEQFLLATGLQLGLPK